MAVDRRTLSSASITVTEIQGFDGDLPAAVASRPSLCMQVSEPIVVELGIEREPHLLNRGDFCTFPRGPISSARWRGPRSLMMVELSPSLLHAELEHRTGISDPQISHLLFALHAELATEAPSGLDYLDAIARAIALRLLTTQAGNRLRGGLSRTVRKRVLDFIDQHLNQDLPLKALAALAGHHEDHFARAFRDSIGETPHRYLQNRRLAHARQLLQSSDLPIADIAQASGFADQSHLTNLFRRHFGTTPGQIRNTVGILQ